VWELTCVWSLDRQQEEARWIREETDTVYSVDDDDSSHSTAQEDHEDDEVLHLRERSGRSQT
jgi:hypothetical protein